jgi:hypothetical protein
MKGAGKKQKKEEEKEDHKQQQGKTKEGNIDSMKTAKLSLKRSEPIERRDTLTLK